MTEKEWRWNTFDGLEMYARYWEPQAPRAVVCFVHGLGEHIGRYPHLAAAYNARGYAVIGFDLRGHGQSGGPRGFTPSFEAFMRDIDGLFSLAEQNFPGLPRFLYGHSLGGILVLNYALRRKPAVRGVLSSAAGLRTALEKQKAKVMLAKVLGSLAPTVAVPSGLDAATISRTWAVVDKYLADPLVHDQLSLGMGKAVMGAIAYAFEHAPEFSLPLLMMHGTADALGYPSGSQEFASMVKGDVTLKLWDGLYHELHNEPEQQQVFDFALDWMDAHL